MKTWWGTICPLLVMTRSSWCVDLHPWSSLPATPTWTKWATPTTAGSPSRRRSVWLFKGFVIVSALKALKQRDLHSLNNIYTAILLMQRNLSYDQTTGEELDRPGSWESWWDGIFSLVLRHLNKVAVALWLFIQCLKNLQNSVLCLRSSLLYCFWTSPSWTCQFFAKCYLKCKSGCLYFTWSIKICCYWRNVCGCFLDSNFSY